MFSGHQHPSNIRIYEHQENQQGRGHHQRGDSHQGKCLSLFGVRGSCLCALFTLLLLCRRWSTSSVVLRTCVDNGATITGKTSRIYQGFSVLILAHLDPEAISLPLIAFLSGSRSSTTAFWGASCSGTTGPSPASCLCTRGWSCRAPSGCWTRRWETSARRPRSFLCSTFVESGKLSFALLRLIWVQECISSTHLMSITIREHFLLLFLLLPATRGRRRLAPRRSSWLLTWGRCTTSCQRTCTTSDRR